MCMERAWQKKRVFYKQKPMKNSFFCHARFMPLSCDVSCPISRTISRTISCLVSCAQKTIHGIAGENFIASEAFELYRFLCCIHTCAYTCERWLVAGAQNHAYAQEPCYMGLLNNNRTFSEFSVRNFFGLCVGSLGKSDIWFRSVCFCGRRKPMQVHAFDIWTFDISEKV